MKYFNKKTEIDGYLFASKKEAAKYQELKLDPTVQKFTLQPIFELQPKFEKDGQKYKAINYIADFDVTYIDGSRKVS